MLSMLLMLLMLALVAACGGESLTATAPVSETAVEQVAETVERVRVPDSPLDSPLSHYSPVPSPLPELIDVRFDGQKAFEHVGYQVEVGPRTPGSTGNRLVGDYIVSYLQEMGWEIEEQTFTYKDTLLRNIIGRVGEGPIVLIGAHYDTRFHADRDAQNPTAPVPGANDGASGVAVLLELARAIDQDKLDYEVWLAFFDAEDNGGLEGWEWIVGSSYMAEHLTAEPQHVIIVDMIGDTNQQIHRERNSDPQLNARVWQLASELGYEEYFLDSPGYSLIDDHTPFLKRGLAAIDIIDFDYPYWHTTADTLDKVDPMSLERVGRVVEAFIEEQP